MTEHNGTSTSDHNLFNGAPRPGHSAGKSIAQVLGVVAAVVLVVVAVRFTPRAATAGDESAVGFVNPDDQRNAMIAELRTLNIRLERIESRLGSLPAIKPE